MMTRWAIRFAGVCALLLLVGGCGGAGKVKVLVKLTKGGQPFVYKEGVMVTISLRPEEEGKDTTPALRNQSKDGWQAEVAPGKYTINTLVSDGIPNPNAPPPTAPGAKKVYEFTKDQTVEVEVN